MTAPKLPEGLEPAKYQEYLRRNLHQAKAVGIKANVKNALVRLRAMKRPPLWMLEALEGIRDRAEGLPHELADWRDSAPDRPYYVSPPGCKSAIDSAIALAAKEAK